MFRVTILMFSPVPFIRRAIHNIGVESGLRLICCLIGLNAIFSIFKLFIIDFALRSIPDVAKKKIDELWFYGAAMRVNLRITPRANQWQRRRFWNLQ